MDYYDFLPDLNKTAERHRVRTQAKVKYCPTCQPYDGGSYVWILGEKTTLEEIYENLNVPERYRDAISEHITCPNCGCSGFDRYDTIGTEDRYVIQTKHHLKTAIKKYGNQITELQEHLQLYPSLALTKTLGKKLHKEILSKKVPSTKIYGEWYRARSVKDNRVFDSSDLDAPGTGIAGDGRYHHTGQSVLYLAKSEETAVNEVVLEENKSQLIWTQKFKVKEIENLLDLRSDFDYIGPSSTSAVLAAILSSGLLEQKVPDRKSTWKPQYFITKFIADCARLAGYSGICYNSTRAYGANVVLFEWDNNSLEKIGKPSIFIYEPAELREKNDDFDFPF
ncbi:RES family NAD+ phosphorylase [Brevibacillus fulvus]|uniref:RES domain-containing protein n=1 Tax=Brevibacillus fulvus TaxID=1125967 RepID=A0A938Y037_9BACL|nr:RES family NAD+ phosphorylase [Brevibacillus fulvus]MBM7590855.1 hypothetical protein [Brevibacillus fulvus]